MKQTVVRQLLYTHATISLLLGALACDANSLPTSDGPEARCIAISGFGETSGDRNKLRGHGTFTFDGVTREAFVGVYLFGMRPGPDGMYVETQYQFNWDGGDTFLTADEILFQPMLEPDHYRFSEAMNIVAASGIFTNQIGHSPLILQAEMVFGPPNSPGDPQSADETLQLGGTICQ